MKVLCICPIGIGNYLMIYPACRAIKEYRPDCSLHLLGLRHSIRDLAEGDPLWDGIRIFDPTKLGPGIGPRLRIVASLRRERFDASLSLFPSNRWEYNALAFMAGVRARFGFTYRLKGVTSLSFLLNRRQPVNPDLHDVHQNLALAGLFIGRNCAGEPMAFPRQFTDEESGWAGRYLGPGQTFVGIHPGSSAEHGMAAKRWPPERFAELADRICGHLDAEALVLGGPDEEDIKRAVCRGMRRTCRFVEPVALRKTAALLSRCSMCVCNDSGLMHMAACMGVPTVGIFGPTDDCRNGPIGDRTLVVRKPLPGFPLWTASTVGTRSAPPGVDPMAPLAALSAEEAWSQILPRMASLVRS